MSDFPKKLQKKLEEREAKKALRKLQSDPQLVDFASNDYLGLATDERLFKASVERLKSPFWNGATGSRLLTGNYALYEAVERQIASFFKAEAALIFNSGYDANLGFFSSVPQRGDLVLYDEKIHASIRDGIQLGNARNYKFKHNDIQDLKLLLKREKTKSATTEIYIVVESVYSMDGDSPDLKAMAELVKTYKANLVVDEAHAIGVCGSGGAGLVAHAQLENVVFARLITFGKALGCHGSAILGANILKTYLLNFARSIIYTTALTPHAVATISEACRLLENPKNKNSIDEGRRQRLLERIRYFKEQLTLLSLENVFIPSDSAIQSCTISGNEAVISLSKKLKSEGFDVRAIRAPSVAEGEERLRFCLHSFNTKEQINEVLRLLSKFV